MDRLENDTRGIELTPEFIEKSDKDITTIAEINKFLTSTGNTLVITGGYATEALCGGNITRPHGDVDMHIILSDTDSVEEVRNQTSRILNSEQTKWVIRERNPKRVDYIEDDEEKEFFGKRRIEVHLVSQDESILKYAKSKLVDSQGKEVEVFVIDLVQTVKEKLRKFYELRNGIDTAKERYSSKSDFYDLNRLLKLKELNREEIKKSMPEEYDYTTSLLSDFQK